MERCILLMRGSLPPRPLPALILPPDIPLCLTSGSLSKRYDSEEAHQRLPSWSTSASAQTCPAAGAYYCITMFFGVFSQARAWHGVCSVSQVCNVCFAYTHLASSSSFPHSAVAMTQLHFHRGCTFVSCRAKRNRPRSTPHMHSSVDPARKNGHLSTFFFFLLDGGGDEKIRN